METAKNFIASFVGQSGQHHTEVDETVAPAVTSETIKPHVHEETTEAIDKEVHQDHYHTTVQPIEHKEVLPEQHTHNLAPQVEKTFEHGDLEQDKEKHAATLAQFQDTQTVQPTTQSATVAPSVAGEHVHHHVHEVVQPVIHKETIQPEVVHTTIPIHEKVIAPSEHHGLSTLPTKTLDEFKEAGTDLTAKHHTHHEYEGHPRPYNAKFQEVRAPVDIDPEAHDGPHDPEKTGHFSRPGTGTGEQVTSGTTTTGAETSAGHGNSAAIGSGVAGVAAGSVAQDLGSDHKRAGENTDLDPKDATGPVGDSGIGAAGTSLGGRTEGNTASGATDAVTSQTRKGGIGGRRASHHEMASEVTPPRVGEKQEPTNLEGGPAKPRATIEHDDNVQHASLIGEDPSLVTSSEVKAGKLTGSGADGSHSAVFGLTPDGHKYDDTKSHIGKSAIPSEEKPEDKDSSKAAEDIGSRGVGTGKVAEQIDDPRVAEKGHDGQASYGESTNKPGAGA